MKAKILSALYLTGVIAIVILGATRSLSAAMEGDNNLKLVLGSTYIKQILAESQNIVIADSGENSLLDEKNNQEEKDSITKIKKKCDGHQTSLKYSVIAYLNFFNINSSFNNRHKIASEYGIKNYQGTADQNIFLLGLLKKVLICE